MWHQTGVAAVQAVEGTATMHDVLACLRILKVHGQI